MLQHYDSPERSLIHYSVCLSDTCCVFYNTDRVVEMTFKVLTELLVMTWFDRSFMTSHMCGKYLVHVFYFYQNNNIGYWSKFANCFSQLIEDDSTRILPHLV